MQSLYEFMRGVLDSVSLDFVRSKMDEIPWEARMLGLVGPRGVGKTTLFLQRIRMSHSLDDTLYVSADNTYFATHTLYDTAQEFMRNGGRFLFIDEVHKYPFWSRELKMIYDAAPDLTVYFTGSSVLDIFPGEADLSRRAPVYQMQGLSFREYLVISHGYDVPVFTLQEILAHNEQLPGIKHPLPLFKRYLQDGYYPFASEVDFNTRLNQMISLTLEFDIPQFAGMTLATGQKLKKLMAVLSAQAPFKPNLVKLSSQISANRNSIDDYFSYMEKAGLIARLRFDGGMGALGKVEKLYLDNPNLLYNLVDGEPDIGTVRETFFFNQARAVSQVVASSISDFEIGGMTFEVGGRSKSGDQLRGVENGYIVRDDIEFGYQNVIPLWAFGLLY